MVLLTLIAFLAAIVWIGWSVVALTKILNELFGE